LLNTKGVTLNELMIVLAIIAIGAAIAVPFYISKLPYLSVRSAGRGLVSDLRLTQNLSVKSSIPYRIVFDVAADTYEIQCTSGTIPPCPADLLPPSAGHPLPHLPTRALGGTGMSAIDLVSVQDSDGNAQNSVQYGGSGAVAIPAENFPVTLRLEAYKTKDTDNLGAIEVELQRGGRLRLVVP
jgi:prepilin-type N-terminal cleavage/methylation domain-containing protein